MNSDDEKEHLSEEHSEQSEEEQSEEEQNDLEEDQEDGAISEEEDMVRINI